MRYYIYLDKDFITSLFSTVDNYNWEIQAVEYSAEYESNMEYNINLSPGVDFSSDLERIDLDGEGSNNDEKNNVSDNTNTNANDSGKVINNLKDATFREARKRNCSKLDMFTGRRNGYNTRIARRYFNLEDVTNARNLTFYNNLIKDLEKEYQKSSFFAFEEGKIVPCNLRSDYIGEGTDENDLFFCINNKHMWVEKEKLKCNLAVVASIVDDVNIIGFSINKNEEDRIYKVLAMYVGDK